MEMTFDKAEGVDNPDSISKPPAIGYANPESYVKPEELDDIRSPMVEVPPDKCPRATAYPRPQCFVKIQFISPMKGDSIYTSTQLGLL